MYACCFNTKYKNIFKKIYHSKKVVGSQSNSFPSNLLIYNKQITGKKLKVFSQKI